MEERTKTTLTRRHPRLISFVIPAHNEEALLGRTVARIAQVATDVVDAHEIIVADDGSTDATARVAADHGARVVRIERRQIAAARNAGARAARGEMLVFVDADTLISRDLLGKAVEAVARGAVGGGALVSFDEAVGAWARCMSASWNVLSRVAHVAAGCFIFVRRDAFDAVGGFDERLFAGEELTLSHDLKQLGRFIILPSMARTSARKVATHTLWETIRLFVRLARTGADGLQQREGLDYWYKRRDTPPARRENE